MAQICVFTGASSGHDPSLGEGARAFGSLRAGRGHGLVYGGGGTGLMGILAQAVLTAGGEGTGVIPRFICWSSCGRRSRRDSCGSLTMPFCRSIGIPGSC